jgi:uncharacterized protein YhhL (DUF1145 family)
LSHNVLGILIVLVLSLISVNLTLPFGNNLVLQAWLNQILIVTLVIVLLSHVVVWMGTRKKRGQKKGGRE